MKFSWNRGNLERMSSKVAHQHVGTAHPAGSGIAVESRVDLAFRKARRHSSLVRMLKLGLPAAAMAMVVAFVARSWVPTVTPAGVEIGGAAIEGGRLVMADPKLEGFTSENRRYRMTAERAIQDIGSADRVDLEGIKARLPFDGSNWIHVKAPTGTFDRAANTLDLEDDLTFRTDTGITALLKSAKVDISAGNLDTPDPVDITMEGTHIVADSLSVRDKGAVMVFRNRVRVVIDARRLQTASNAEDIANEN